MIITVDTSEDKSVRLIDEYFLAYKALHPFIAKKIEWKLESLDYGDFRSDYQLIEVKIAGDLESSLNSGHLQEQCRYMLQQSPKMNRHLLVYDVTDPAVRQRAYEMATEYCMFVHWADSPHQLIDKIITICRTPQYTINLDLPVKESGVETSLVSALCYAVKGLGRECAAEIVGWRKTFEDLVEDLSAEKVQKTVFEFYGKEMQALTDKVCKAIWGETA
jgi:hypothetical protein